MRMSFPEGLTSPEMEMAEGGIILDNRTRFTDLKAMLDSSKDNLKVDAMKRIINLIAKGKDVNELFPAVVKNVAAKNIELKKLVYVYLVRYAEEQQDLALLSISTFQRALKDPNQLIRASALRVLSSIRVGMIAPIMLLAIKDSVRDMSPYVRKVAAHAIPKLYALEPDLESELIECIDFLLADRRSLVLGSAVYAFEEICPSRFELIHKHYRTLCRTLPDVDEWGQVMMMQMLTRYARSNLAEPEEGAVDSDLALLLNASRPLLQSRNCSVVMAVTQLFYHVAPKSQLSQVARALVRLLRGPREVQYVVLLNMATICERNPVQEGTFAISKNMFDPWLKSFFLRSSDPAFVRDLKLHVLTGLVSESNVHIILRELQTYVSNPELAGAAVEAIGRCAVRVGAVSQQCMTGLVQLIASPHDHVVCAAVCVLKRLLHAEAPVALLQRLARLHEKIVAPEARACVVWLIATHVQTVVHIAPDFLRILAKSFATEHDMVKLEILKLAVRLWMLRQEECGKLVQYVLQLARYDLSYDVRDRCRFLRSVLFNTSLLAERAEDIFMYNKPAPALASSFKDRDQFQLGSLSHALNQRCAHYKDLPDFPETSSDPALRRDMTSLESPQWEEDDEEEEEEEEVEYEDEEEEEDEDEEVEETETDEDEESEEDEEDEEEEESNSDEEETVAPRRPTAVAASTSAAVKKKGADTGNLLNGRASGSAPKKATEPATSAMDMLLDLDFSAAGSRQLIEPLYVSDSWRRVVNPVEGAGLELSVSFPRGNCSQFTPIKFCIKNCGKETVEVNSLKPSGETAVQHQQKSFVIDADAEVVVEVRADLSDSSRKTDWNVVTGSESEGFSFSLEVPLGEQVQPVRITTDDFETNRKRLSGLSRHEAELSEVCNEEMLLRVINACPISKGMYACQTRSRKDIVLIAVDSNKVQVCSDNTVVGRVLANKIRDIVSTS